MCYFIYLQKERERLKGISYTCTSTPSAMGTLSFLETTVEMVHQDPYSSSLWHAF